MVKFLIVGPLSKDRIIKGNMTYNSVGGAVYYQSAVFSAFGIKNTVVTTLNKSDRHLLENFSRLTKIATIPSIGTLEFENRYPDNNPNHRIQKVKAFKNSIKPADFKDLNFEDYRAILISPLTPYDIPLSTLQFLSKQSNLIYLGAQGYLRHTSNGKVTLKPWEKYTEYLKYVDHLFLDISEGSMILNDINIKPEEMAYKLSKNGPQEVILTRGDKGAVIFSKLFGRAYEVPAKPPKKIVDPTGLGDTFMAAYAIKKLETDEPDVCAKFAACISSEKMGQNGAYKIHR